MHSNQNQTCTMRTRDTTRSRDKCARATGRICVLYIYIVSPFALLPPAQRAPPHPTSGLKSPSSVGTASPSLIHRPPRSSPPIYISPPHSSTTRICLQQAKAWLPPSSCAPSPAFGRLPHSLSERRHYPRPLPVLPVPSASSPTRAFDGGTVGAARAKGRDTARSEVARTISFCAACT